MSHDVISAFLDEEPFDAEALGAALAEPGGRELLLDLIALRALVHDDVAALATTMPRQRRRWIASGFIAAAALFAALVWVAPSLLMPPARAHSRMSTDADAPPTPDRVIQFQPGVDWHNTITSGESR
jgi:hypothetical protein